MENTAFLAKLTEIALTAGAYKAQVIPASEIVTDRSFREMCAANACGVYGKCWTCPPYVGEIDELMAAVKTYEYALVYQTVSPLEDSYDIEGMAAARKTMFALTRRIRRDLDGLPMAKLLHLGAGACGVCDVCAKSTDEPCRFPHLAMASLEAYGIHVSALAETAGMKYINGVNTVTYFGAVLFSL